MCQLGPEVFYPAGRIVDIPGKGPGFTRCANASNPMGLNATSCSEGEPRLGEVPSMLKYQTYEQSFGDVQLTEE